jgi:hypothetical protein
MARAEHVDIQFPTWTERNLQPTWGPRERMELKPASPAHEGPGYTQLQRQIHDALRAQHPEWIQPNGDSPICDSYESRFAELLRLSLTTTATPITRNAPRFAISAAQDRHRRRINEHAQRERVTISLHVRGNFLRAKE